MAAPTIRSVGTVNAGVGAITFTHGTGTTTGDLILVFVENSGEAATTISGYTQLAASTTQAGSRLYVLYRIATGADTATTNDVGDHQLGRSITITAGTFDATSPFGASTVVTNGQASTTSISISGGTTNRNDCLIFAASAGDLPDSSSTTQFGAATNASLTSITERVDNTTNTGNGGAIYVVTGTLATAGTYNATTLTASNAAVRNNASFSVRPPSTTGITQAAYGFYEDGTETGSTEIDTATYYFDASDAAASDPNNAWTNDANAFNGNITDGATGTLGSTSSNYLMAEGTNAPTTGGVIKSVMARLYRTGTGETVNAAIYTNGLSELLGTPSAGTGTWSQYVTLATPSGGWTWQKISELETKVYISATFEGGGSVRRVEVLVQTETIRNVTSDSNLQLRVRLQETSGGYGDNTDDYQLQYELNDSGTYQSVGPIAVYSESNVVDYTGIYGSAATRFGQSFVGDGSTIASASLYIRKAGSPTGSITASIYAHTGTFGSTGTPTGSALATSSAVDITTLSTSATLVSFTFSGAGAITLTAATNYFIALEYTGGDASNLLEIGFDSTSPTHSGNSAYYFGSSWTAQSSDLAFYIYSPRTVTSYNSASLTDGNATTNRLGAGSGSFVAGEISEDGLVDDHSITPSNSVTPSNYTEHLYSLTLVSSALSDNDTLDFRVLRNGATTDMTYTVTPRITVSKSAGGSSPGSFWSMF